LEKFKSQSGERTQMLDKMQSMEDEVRTNPDDYTNLFSLAGIYLQLQQTNRANALFAQAISRPHVPMEVLRGVANFFAQTAQFAELEKALKKLTDTEPNAPETWYDLSRLEVLLGKKDEAIQDLRTSVNLSDQRLKTSAKALDIRAAARSEAGFNPIRGSPEFQKLVSP
jgi:cytochrome c-type biogenesis protein CcmH/NrfG